MNCFKISVKLNWKELEDFIRGRKSCDLAFFSVVASCPNLSTFFITAQKYTFHFEWQNIFV